MKFRKVFYDGRPVYRAMNDDGVAMLFSCGPATGTGAYGSRMTRLLAAMAPGLSAVRWCDQIHGKLLASLSPEPEAGFSGVGCVGRCDGLLTDERGVGLVVWTADCVPVLLAGGSIVAAVHAGWRGAAAGIVPAAVRRFFVEYGIRAADLTVVMGPAIGACHYQVGEEVVVALAATGVPEAFWRDGDRVDLRGFLGAQLEGAGVRPSAWSLVGGCTACTPACASYRRDAGRADRQWSMIYRMG